MRSASTLVAFSNIMVQGAARSAAVVDAQRITHAATQSQAPISFQPQLLLAGDPHGGQAEWCSHNPLACRAPHQGPHRYRL